MPQVNLTQTDREYAKCLRDINGSLKENRMTIAQLAVHIRKDRTTLGRKLRGEIPFTLMEYLEISRVLKGEHGKI